MGSLPAMGPNRRAQERERAAALAAEKAKRDEAERKASAFARKITEIWNARQAGGRALWFYPTIGAAMAAGVPLADFLFPSLRPMGISRSAEARPASGRINLQPDPVPVMPKVLSASAVCPAGDADRR